MFKKFIYITIFIIALIVFGYCGLNLGKYAWETKNAKNTNIVKGHSVWYNDYSRGYVKIY